MSDKTIMGMRAPELQQLYKDTIEDIKAIKAALTKYFTPLRFAKNQIYANVKRN